MTEIGSHVHFVQDYFSDFLRDLNPTENDEVFSVTINAMIALPTIAVSHTYELPAATSPPVVEVPSTLPGAFFAALWASLPPVPHTPFCGDPTV